MYFSTWVVCHTGRGKKSENPPPENPTVVSGIKYVAPTAVTLRERVSICVADAQI